MKKLIVFDCDGTLVNSAQAIVDAMTAAFNAHQIEAPKANDVLRQTGLPGEVMVARLRPEFSRSQCLAINQDFISVLRRSRADGDIHPLYPGVIEMLVSLDAGFCLAIATGMGRPGLDYVFSSHPIRHHFSSLQTADVSPGKPNPAMLYQAMAEGGAVAGETVMIGDTTHDAEFARNADVDFIGVSWGFHNKQELQDAGAIAVVDQVSELVALLG